MTRTHGPALTLLSTRIATHLFDRMHIYKGSTRMTIQEITEAALVEYLDRVDPVGKIKAEKLARIAAETQQSEGDRLTRVEGILAKIASELGLDEKPHKKAAGK